LLIGGVDFGDLALTLKAPLEGATAVTIKYGKFIQMVMDFIIVAFAIFIMVKVINRLKKKEVAAPTVPTMDQQLLMEIRDLLKDRR
jgi:large conductance mechanosensitive channel